MYFRKVRQTEDIHVDRVKAAYYAILSGLMIGIGGLSGGGVIMAGLLAIGKDMLGTVATSSCIPRLDEFNRCRDTHDWRGR